MRFLHPGAKLLAAISIAAGASLFACGGSDQVGPGGIPKRTLGISVVSGANATDTIGATLPQALTVEVRDSSGSLAPNTVVRFNTLPASNLTNSAVVGLLVSGLEQGQFGSFASASTNESGRASVVVQMGMVSGPVRLVASVPTLALVDTISLVALPGAPVRIAPLSADTGVTLGATIHVRVVVMDRAGNPRPDPVTFDPSPDPTIATVTGDGTVTGVKVGQTPFTAHGNNQSAIAWVTVVPSGTLAAVDPNRNGVAVVNLDGSGYDFVASCDCAYSGNGGPRWGDAGAIVFSNKGRLFSIVPGGSPVQLNSAGTPGATTEAWPDYAPATRTTVYSAQVSLDSTGWNYQWRLFARAANGAVTPLSAEAPTDLAWRGAVSPDGTKIAYVTVVNAKPSIRVYDVASGITSSWSVPGQNPRWSPKGDRIAFVQPISGPISLMNADGTNIHQLTTISYSEIPFDWSPDGAWIIARTPAAHAELVNTVTAERVPVTYLDQYLMLAWKH